MVSENVSSYLRLAPSIAMYAWIRGARDEHEARASGASGGAHAGLDASTKLNEGIEDLGTACRRRGSAGSVSKALRKCCRTAPELSRSQCCRCESTLRQYRQQIAARFGEFRR